ncbi:MAG: hypothetical protein AAFY97_03835 [Pseudomonadota bacterium]
MRAPRSYSALETLGRARLSRHFEMRNFMTSEIANFHRLQNFPGNPDLALAAGRKLATECLDPLVETFGPIDIRSGYRSPEMNHFGATQVKPQKCARNEANFAHHIWDIRDHKGRMGACVTVGIPWFAAQYNAGRDWRDLAWWLWDHLDFQEVYFFPKNAAFNITWREGEMAHRMLSYITPKGVLWKPGHTPDPERRTRYQDFPEFRGIVYPEVPQGPWEDGANGGDHDAT